MPTNINLPANLPENWQAGQIVSPSGTEVGLSAQHGYNYLMQQVNDTQKASNALSQAVDSQEEAQTQLETDVEDLQTDVGDLQNDVGELQTDVGNLQTGQGQLATPNATATHSDSVVAITAPAGVNLISFYAPSDFSGDDTYTVNGSAVTLTDLNGNAIYDGWKEGAPVQLILKGAQAFFKSGGGVNDTLPPINPNMTGELADGVFTVTADKLPVAQADALAGAEWYYADHVPARPGDGTKIEFTKEQLVDYQGGKTAADYTPGDIVTIKENGVAQEFYIAKHGYPATDNGRTLLVRRYIHSQAAWRATSNVNTYASSTIDSWMEETYYAMFSESVRAMISAVDILYTPGGGNNTVTTLSRKVFALSVTELGVAAEYANIEGSALPIADTLQIAHQASNESAVEQWTRSPYAVSSSNACYLNSSGGINNATTKAIYGYRPAFTIPSTALFDPDTNELIEDATEVQTLADTTNLGDEAAGSTVTLDSGEVITDNGSSISVAIPWAESSYIYVRQFPYNAKHQYQTQLVGAVATNDPDYDSGSIAPGIPDFSYTGTYEIIDDGDGNKRVKFYTSGTLVMTKTCVVDAFYVGGGSGGASQASTSGFAPGGGGGYTATHHSITLEANTEYVITIGAGGVGTRTLTPSNGGETSAFGFSISGGQGANGGSGGGATGLSRDNDHNAEGGDGGSNGLGGEKAYHYTASTSGTLESTTQGTGQGTTTAEFGEEGNELYSGGGGGAGLWTDGGSTRRAIGGNGGAGGETNSGGIGGNTNSWDGASGNAVPNGIGGQGGKISRPSSSDYHPAGGGGGGGYGGGGGAGACGRGSTGQGGDGYHGIVIIRNHREAS